MRRCLASRRSRLGLLFALSISFPVSAAEFRGRVLDARSGKPIAARVYLQAPDGSWKFVQPADPNGATVPYAEQWVPMPQSVERHSSVSAHDFKADLEPGEYRVTIERGKEYLPLERVVKVGRGSTTEEFRLQRWINPAERGWYSGETHVHRRVEELPLVMESEDLNVAFPVTYWTVASTEAPTTAPSPLRPRPDPLGARKDLGTDPIHIDATHVMIPRNTEYEIFSVGDKRHVLGAVFLLNHKTRFTEKMPPTAAIAAQAHREGALLDLDKHNWPWSLMVVPIARVDLFELANNSVWRTNFGFRNSLVAAPSWMKVEQDAGGMTERGWLEFGFQTYYTLLNCGFPITPTAGTASGVHPVPLGYGRVYVHMDGPFRVDRWIEGLKAGRSFVTTGPMLFAKLDDQLPGHRFRFEEQGARTLRLKGEALAVRPISRLEIIVNGAVERTIKPSNEKRAEGGFGMPFEADLKVDETSWIAVRCFETMSDGRERFAHTAPFHVLIADAPIRPRREETDWLTSRMREEIARNKGILSPEALAEYEQALAIYEKIAKRAKD